MTRDWKKDFKKFLDFLKSVDIQEYTYLRQIKTVEQDLPRGLLPLEMLYKYYWDDTNFKNFDDFFNTYWSEKLNPHIYEFIKKYFYGCSLQFVEEGFRARLYRIWMSILTQFHFQYLWNTLFKEKLISSPKLDAMGIDAIVELESRKVAIQIKKVSYRREASDRRFTTRQKAHAEIIVEVPYLVVDTAELENKLKNPRVREHKKIKYQKALDVFNKNFLKLDNGFVIFKEEYLSYVYKVILEKIKTKEKGDKVPYYEILTW